MGVYCTIPAVVSHYRVIAGCVGVGWGGWGGVTSGGLFCTVLKVVITVVLPVMLVVVAFSSLARILGEGWTIYSPPAIFFQSGDQLAHTSSFSFFSWWPGSVHSACELLLGSFIMPGQYSQSTPTSLN